MSREPTALLLAAFLITFVLTRTYTRLARAHGWGSASANGIHVHHMVVGIILILLSGLVEIASRPSGLGRDAIAIVFGVGAAFTLDEFALWLYLRDVYWSEEGHRSVDASVIGVLLAGLFLVGLSPFGVHDGGRAPRLVAFIVVAASVGFALITFAKGKLTLGVLAVFVPPVGLVCAVRLGKPRSLWARRFYGEHKLERAHRRFENAESWLVLMHERIDDVIGGAPSTHAMFAPAMQMLVGRLNPQAQQSLERP
jgi:hypothetical protein